MKILYVATGLSLGGAEKVVADLADHMVLRGHEVKIAYLTGDVIVKPKSDQVEIIYLGLESGKDFISASRKYRQLIKQYQPDVVHAHMVHANIFTRLNRVGCSVPKLICTAHSSHEGGKIRMLAYKYTNFLSDFNSNVSKKAAQIFIEKGAFTPKNIQGVYNGIDLNKFIKKDNNRSNEQITFLAVGRLNEQKDYPNLLRALHLVIQQTKNIHLNIVGDGELRADLENMIQELGLNDYVSLLGRRDDVAELMSQSDYFVLPSKNEGFGLVVAEAMACEVFVIATDSGGVKEVMGDHGLLVEPQNSTLLAEAMLQAMDLSEEEIIENNQKALEYVTQNFDINKIVNQWISIYES